MTRLILIYALFGLVRIRGFLALVHYRRHSSRGQKVWGAQQLHFVGWLHDEGVEDHQRSKSSVISLLHSKMTMKQGSIFVFLNNDIRIHILLEPCSHSFCTILVKSNELMYCL